MQARSDNQRLLFGAQSEVENTQNIVVPPKTDWIRCALWSVIAHSPRVSDTVPAGRVQSCTACTTGRVAPASTDSSCPVISSSWAPCHMCACY